MTLLAATMHFSGASASLKIPIQIHDYDYCLPVTSPLSLVPIFYLFLINIKSPPSSPVLRISPNCGMVGLLLMMAVFML